MNPKTLRPFNESRILIADVTTVEFPTTAESVVYLVIVVFFAELGHFYDRVEIWRHHLKN